MCSDLVTASQICALFSATGILFMFYNHWHSFIWIFSLTMLYLMPSWQSFVGTLLIKQPFFILGIDDVEAAKVSAFGAAGTFFFTFLISVIYLLVDGHRVNAEIISGATQLRGRIQQTNRFGEYSTVAFSDDVGGNNNNEFHYA